MRTGFAQSFSVRRRLSTYSQANIERLRALAKQGRIAKDVQESLPDLSRETLAVPADILMAIKARKRAWKNFQRFSESYLHIRIAYIDGARNRPGEFKKRLAHFVRMTEDNRQFGFGGIDKYY